MYITWKLIIPMSAATVATCFDIEFEINSWFQSFDCLQSVGQFRGQKSLALVIEAALHVHYDRAPVFLHQEHIMLALLLDINDLVVVTVVHSILPALKGPI